MDWFLTTVVVPVVIIGILILVHELGHFLLAKYFGVGVVRFSIGFGPALLKFRWGLTEYRVGAIPLGGYVRMVGDVPDFVLKPADSDEEVTAPSDTPQEFLRDRSCWFIEKGLFAKFSIVFAGPLFNFVSAVVFIFLAVWLYGEEVPLASARLGTVMNGSPAQQAGLQADDVVLALNGESISSWDQLSSGIRNGTGEPVQLTIRRAETESVVVVKPERREIRTGVSEKTAAYLIGIKPGSERRDVSVVRSAGLAWRWTYNATKETYLGLWGMVSGAISPDELAGPIFIFAAAKEKAKKGLEEVLFLMALLSVSLAVLNLLPVPVLDGGHLMFFLLEAAIGPIGLRKKEIAQQVGLFLLLLLMGFAVSNDLRRDHRQLSSETGGWEKESEPDPRP